MRYAFHTLDVFTDHVFGGNPLAVFPDAAGLDPVRMQKIARELNLSETTFVLPPTRAGSAATVRIFTPGVELPFAGHPTVGTACLLTELGRVPLDGHCGALVLDEAVGPVPVTVRVTAGAPTFAQLSAARLPEWGPAAPSREQIATVLGLTSEDILDDTYRIEGVSCGVPFLFVPLRDAAALARCRLDMAAWQGSVASSWAPHVFPLVPGSATIRARMFAPALGIAEDPATGGAASALTGYLARREAHRTGTLRWTLQQGVEMGRPSLMYLEADVQDGEVRAARVGGTSVRVSDGTMDVPA
jgi:trans-2,3-dihydro-3-hydroxyanthranilate isomerase